MVVIVVVVIKTGYKLSAWLMMSRSCHTPITRRLGKQQSMPGRRHFLPLWVTFLLITGLLRVCITQDRVSYAVVTNNPQISVGQNKNDLCLVYTTYPMWVTRRGRGWGHCAVKVTHRRPNWQIRCPSEYCQSVPANPEGECAPEALASVVKCPSPEVAHVTSLHNSLGRTAHGALTCHKRSMKCNCPMCWEEERPMEELEVFL